MLVVGVEEPCLLKCVDCIGLMHDHFRKQKALLRLHLGMWNGARRNLWNERARNVAHWVDDCEFRVVNCKVDTGACKYASTLPKRRTVSLTHARIQ